MGKILWHVTMSLDGFISGLGDDMGWMSDFFGPNPTVDEVQERIIVVLKSMR